MKSLTAHDGRTFVDARIVRNVISELKTCRFTRDLRRGKLVHRKMTEVAGHKNDAHLSSALISMYAACGSISMARSVFDNMEDPDVVCWTALIMGYVENGEGSRALDVFLLMRGRCVPNARTFVAALKACTLLASMEQVLKPNVKIESLKKGWVVHSQAVESGYGSNIYVETALVSMYVECGCMDGALRVFKKMGTCNLVAWNAMILGYATNGKELISLEFLGRMRSEGCAPNDVTMVAALKACSNLAMKENPMQKGLKLSSLKTGMALHSLSIDLRCDSCIYVRNALISMYAKCGSMNDARGVFDSVQEPDVVAWNSLIMGYVNNGEENTALRIFHEMQCQVCNPNGLTFVAVIKACAQIAQNHQKNKALETGILLHSRAIACRLCPSNTHVQNALVDMYAKCGSIDDARKVFEQIKRPTLVSWNAMIMGYAENGNAKMALLLFSSMASKKGDFSPDFLTFVAALKACVCLYPEDVLAKGVFLHSEAVKYGCHSNVFVANGLINMYAKCGRMYNARKVFDNVENRDVVLWNTLILGYAENGESDLAMELLVQMQASGNAPTASTFVGALKACGRFAALDVGKEIHTNVLSLGLAKDEMVANALLDMYCKCGSMDDALHVFESMRTKGLVSWTTLMAGYARQGDVQMVFDLFDALGNESIKPNGITFLCVLSACRHAGLVDKGKKYFDEMMSKHKIVPTVEHYTCIIDMLCRANELRGALQIMQGMPYEPDAVIWTAFLCACTKWRNVGLGKLAFESLLRLKDNASAFVLMVNMHESKTNNNMTPGGF